jgi:putative ABC transport system ATP-binding protein
MNVRTLNATRVYDDGYREPVRALDEVTLEVQAGELVALVGPSGCGKSTLLNLIGCVDLPTSGTVEVDGRPTTLLDDDALTALRRDRIGTVFQFFNLLPTLTIAENVGLPLVLQRRDRREIYERVRTALETVGIPEKAESFPAHLSGGQLQRTAIARAIVHEPAIVLADEPTGNLDTENGANVLHLLRELASGGQAILMATHAPEAAALSDRVLRLKDGRLSPPAP